MGGDKEEKKEKKEEKKKKGFTRKLLLEICISFLKESWAAGTQRRRVGERAESLALDMDPAPCPLTPAATSSSPVTTAAFPSPLGLRNKFGNKKKVVKETTQPVRYG